MEGIALTKKAMTFLLILFAPAFCAAQTSTSHQAAGDIKVLEATWSYGSGWSDTAESSPGRLIEQRRENNQMGPLDSEQAVFLRTRRYAGAGVVTVRNDGPKRVKAIRYDFIFVNTLDGKQWLRYQFRNRVALGPGETKTLTNQVVDRRSVTFRPNTVDPATGTNSEIRVVINRVEYADGSVWRLR